VLGRSKADVYRICNDIGLVKHNTFACRHCYRLVMRASAQGNSPEPTVSTAVAYAHTPPLSELMKLPQPMQCGFHEANPVRFIAKRNSGTSADPVQQSELAAASHYSILANVLGIGNGFPGYTVSDAPPDTNMAVGQTQIVQWVNVSFTVCDKATLTCGAATLGNTLWSSLPPGALCHFNDGDIIAQYDTKAPWITGLGTGRWFMAQNVFHSPYAVCVAISDTDNALGGWTVWEFPQNPVVPGLPTIPLGFPDYPKWGIWPTARRT
jgi:hypothetical protein